MWYRECFEKVYVVVVWRVVCQVLLVWDFGVEVGVVVRRDGGIEFRVGVVYIQMIRFYGVRFAGFEEIGVKCEGCIVVVRVKRGFFFLSWGIFWIQELLESLWRRVLGIGVRNRGGI